MTCVSVQTYALKKVEGNIKRLFSFDGISSYTFLHITLKYQKKLFLDVRIKEKLFSFFGGRGWVLNL